MNNSLAEVHPELVLEWSEKTLPLTPDDLSFFAGVFMVFPKGVFDIPKIVLK